MAPSNTGSIVSRMKALHHFILATSSEASDIMLLVVGLAKCRKGSKVQALGAAFRTSLDMLTFFAASLDGG
eukprot:5860307-Pyramimonas_sp.AAC.5